MSSFNDIGLESEGDYIADSKSPAPLTISFHATSKDSELNLVLKYQQTDTPAHRHEHDRLGRQLADAFKSYCRNAIMLICPHPETYSTLTYDDLFNEAQFAVLKSALRYNPDKGATFRTYATQRIRGSIIDLLRDPETNSFGLSRRDLEIMNAWKKFTEAAPEADDTNCPLRLRSEFIASVQKKHTKMSTRAVENVINLAALRNVPLCIDADDTELEGGVTEGSLSDPSVNDPSDLVSIQESNEHAIRILNKGLQSLNANEKSAVFEKLFGTMTYAEQASIQGVTESRICQLTKAGTEKLHMALRRDPEAEGICWQDLRLGLSADRQLVFVPRESRPDPVPTSAPLPPQLSESRIQPH